MYLIASRLITPGARVSSHGWRVLTAFARNAAAHPTGFVYIWKSTGCRVIIPCSLGAACGAPIVVLITILLAAANTSGGVLHATWAERRQTRGISISEPMLMGLPTNDGTIPTLVMGGSGACCLCGGCWWDISLFFVWFSEAFFMRAILGVSIA